MKYMGFKSLQLYKLILNVLVHRFEGVLIWVFTCANMSKGAGGGSVARRPLVPLALALLESGPGLRSVSAPFAADCTCSCCCAADGGVAYAPEAASSGGTAQLLAGSALAICVSLPLVALRHVTQGLHNTNLWFKG